MRRITLQSAPLTMEQSEEGRFIARAFQEIARASHENDPAVIASDFTVSNYTETRALDVGTATSTDLMNFVATFIRDLQRGGAKKG